MLTPEYLAGCTSYLLGMMDALDRTIIADISRRIVKTGVVTPTAKDQADKVQQSGMLLSDVIQQVAVTTKKTDEEIAKLFRDASIHGLQNDVRPLVLAGQNVDVRLSPAMQQILQATIQKTNGDVRNLSMTLGSTAANKYIEAVNAATMKVQSGTFSYAQAIRDAVKEAADDGNWVTYTSGHRDRLDVAIRRSVLTGVNQTSAKLTEMNAEALGAEYYETTAHAGARPSHSLWQGRVFKIHGETKEYPNFEDKTGYGTGAGLCGWNCRHSFYPFWPGISVPAYTQEMLDSYNEAKFSYNGEKMTEYEVSQEMRGMERDMRKTKREIAGLQAAYDAADDSKLKADLKADLEKASVRLKQQEAEYRNLCKQTNHKPDTVRTGVAAIKDDKGNILSFNQSAAQRTRRLVERVEKSANTEYNKGSTQANVRQYLADESTRKRLRSDKVNKTIHWGKQDKHIQGTNNYTEGRSYLTIPKDEIPILVEQYAGTGRIIRKPDGTINNREICTTDRIIGTVVDPETGAEMPTHCFSIRYSKKGVHIVPAKEG